MKRKKKILVCDDETDFLALLKLHLEKQGYQVETVDNGEAALKAVNDSSPDIMLLDINMPQMSGLEVYQRLATRYGRTRIPIVVFTTREELGEVFRDIDADAFLPKPFEINVLFSHIEKILNRETEPEVFLVDLKDDPHAKAIRDALTQERFRVTTVEDLEDLKKMSPDPAPDFIVMEYMQKDVGGENFIKAVKEIPALARVPLVVYSYSGFDKLGETALKLGADDYIGKPEKPQDVITAVRKLELKAKENRS